MICTKQINPARLCKIHKKNQKSGLIFGLTSGLTCDIILLVRDKESPTREREERTMKNTYSIYLNSIPMFLGIKDMATAYDTYEKTKVFADKYGKTLTLVWADTGEVLACHGKE